MSNSTSIVEMEDATESKYSDQELELLGPDIVTEGFDSDDNELTGLKCAPIFTDDVLKVCSEHVFPQRALYGRIISQNCKGFPTRTRSPKLYINTNATFSGVLCGVQGSGKSHSTSVLLESCLIQDERLGTLPEPMSALLFNFDTTAGVGRALPCEAANLACLDEKRGGNAKPPSVKVLVMPGSLHSMKKAYAELSHVSVEALHFSQEDMTGERLLTIMKMDQEHQMPLYMECIMNTLRGMEHAFDYDRFRRELTGEKFSNSQKAMLDLRLSLLDSCLKGGNASNRVSNHFKKGQLTIVDLTSPFMDCSSACGFFDIILGLFVEAKTKASGKLVVLDEAHKYLTSNSSSSRLTDSLLSVIRQHRHLATRVLISTQEPTVVPSEFLDLCSFVIAHRFSSPRWLEHLERHISSADAHSFDRVSTLKTGEAMIFSPAGVGLPERTEDRPWMSFGSGHLLVRSRTRITKDGGYSLMATKAERHTNADNPAEEEARETCLLFNSVDSVRQVMSPAPSLDYSSDSAHSHRYTQAVNAINHAQTSGLLPTQRMENKKASLKDVVITSGIVKNRPAITAPQIELPDPPKVADRFRPLLAALLARGRMTSTEIGTELKNKQPPAYKGKLKTYLREALCAQVVEIRVAETGQEWVHVCPSIYTPLIKTVRRLHEEGDTRMSASVVAERMKKYHPAAFPGTFKHYVRGAEAAGLIPAALKITF